MLLNLLSNTIDSMAVQDGARLLRVRSSVHDSGGVIVAVEDTGTGVEPKDMERIFTAASPASAARSSADRLRRYGEPW